MSKPSPKSPAPKPGATPIIDVAHPGKSAPADTSKPIITHRGAMMQDPMMATRTTAPVLATPPAKPENLAPTAKVHLHPDSTTAPAIDPEAELAVPLPEAVTDDPQPEPEAEPTPEPPVKPVPDDPKPAATTNAQDAQNAPVALTEPSTEPEEPIGPVADKQLAADQSDELEAKAASERAEYEAKLQKAYDSRQYFLPINTLEKRRSKQFVVMGVLLSVLLLIAWADIALDASLIHLGDIKPLTHFFSS